MRPRWRAVAWSIVALLAVWGFVLEPQQLVVRRTRFSPPRWPAALHGLRVLAISDLHVGNLHMSLSRLSRVVQTANAEHPDLIVLLGDFVSTATKGDEQDLADMAEVLRGLSAPLGVHAVLGNHDWWLDGPRVRRALEHVGIDVLDDRALRLAVHGAPLWLVGLGDETTQSSVPVRVLDDAAIPAADTIVCITHNPDVFPRVPVRVALTLAGHTHGGQVRVPIVGAPIVPSRYQQRYVRGHIVEHGHDLFVTTGAGTSVLPLRFGVPPEIAVLTLD